MGAEYTKDGKSYGLNYDDMVILVSSVKKIPELIQALQSNGIDFIVEGTQKLFEATEIQAVCNAFNVIFEIIETYDKNSFNYSQIQINDELIQQWVPFSPLNRDEIKNALAAFIAVFHKSDAYEYTIQENLKTLFADLHL